MDATFLREYQELKRRVAELEAREYMGKVTYADSGNLSAFGRLRVADAGNRSDVEFIYDKQPLLFDDISAGTGSATHQATPRDVLLAVGGTGSTAIGGLRQHYHVPYTAGNGQLIFITGVMDKAAIGGGTASTFIRTTVTGSTVTTTTAQSAWNQNVATTVDWSKSQIFGIDFQSLKVGRIRYYLDREGVAVLVHDIDNDNVRNTGYWQYPSLPPYWKLYNTETTTIMEIGYGDELNGVGFMYDFGSVQTSATAVAICETVKSEGGLDLFDMPGFPFVAYNLPTVPVSATSTTVYQPLLSIQVASTFNSIANRAVYIPTEIEVTVDNPIFYKVIYRGTLTGASFAAVDTVPYTGLDKDVSATAISGGYEVGAGSFTTGRNVLSSLSNTLGRVIMSLGYTATSDILSVVAVKTTASNAACTTTIRGRIIR